MTWNAKAHYCEILHSHESVPLLIQWIHCLLLVVWPKRLCDNICGSCYLWPKQSESKQHLHIHWGPPPVLWILVIMPTSHREQLHNHMWMKVTSTDSYKMRQYNSIPHRLLWLSKEKKITDGDDLVCNNRS